MSEIILAEPLKKANQQAINVLTRAFWNDPLMCYIAPSEKERGKLAGLFDITLKYGELYGEMYTTPDIRGVSIWVKPYMFQVTLRRIIRVGMWKIPILVGIKPFIRLMKALAVQEKLHHRDVQPNHWYLFYLAVDPLYQKQGVGRALMQPIFERADQDKIPCYLETTNAINVSFYEKHGFTVITACPLPGGVKCWTMRRDT